MKWQDNKPYYSLNQYYKELFGEKTYKIALNIGVTCPNRDGTLDTRGCIFCSDSGSGDFATDVDPASPDGINNQIASAINKVRGKYSGNRFIAYLQSYTNTYGNTEQFKKTYSAILEHEGICGLSIGTRPDCLDDGLLDHLSELNKAKPVFIELGLQTIHETSATYIRRCYPLSVFEDAVIRLRQRNIPVIVHLIAGLPGENADDFLQSVAYLANKPIQGIKLQLLHIIDGTDLAKEHKAKPFSLLTLDQYARLIVDAIAILPADIVIHRITGDGSKDTLIAPLWSLNKRNVLNTIHKTFTATGKWQGCDIDKEKNNRKKVMT